jgi:hypothetical protein
LVAPAVSRDVIVHEEGVDDERRRGAEQRAGHDLAPVEDVALDQRGDDADRQHQLGGRGREGQRIEELRPRHGEAEDRRGDDAGQRHRDEDLGERLDPVAPSISAASSSSLGIEAK